LKLDPGKGASIVGAPNVPHDAAHADSLVVHKNRVVPRRHRAPKLKAPLCDSRVLGVCRTQRVVVVGGGGGGLDGH
jgi:hypothetical protein